MTLTRETVKKELDSIGKMRDKIDRMNEISMQLKESNFEWAEELAREALECSRKSGYIRGEALALANIGSVLGRQSLLNESNDYLEKAAGMLKGLPGEQQKGLHQVLVYLGFNLTKQERYLDAASHFREALNLSEAWGDVKVTGQVYSNLSIINAQLGRFTQSRDYLLKAVEILEHTTFYEDLSLMLNNLGYTYNKMGHFEEALKTMKRAGRLVRKRKLSHHRMLIISSTFKVYLNMGKYDKAERLLAENRKLIRNEKRPLYKAYILLYVATLFEKKGDLKKALQYGKKARKVIIINNLNFIKNDMYKLLYHVYKKMRCFRKALFYHEAYGEHEKLSSDKEVAFNIKNVEADSLREANRRIEFISETGQHITASLDVAGVFDRIHKSLSSLMDAPNFGIVAYDRKTGILSYQMFVADGDDLSRTTISINDKNSLAAYVIRNRKEIIINDLESEFNHYIPGLKPTHLGKDNSIQSLLFVPLQTGNVVSGVVTVQSSRKNAYSLYDLEALKALASYIAIALKNANQSELIQEQNSELHAFHQKTKTDLMMARKLQFEMIPSVFPRSSMYAMYGYYHPIDELGGDLYDVFRISEDKTAVFILDVVGHGVYAALITAMAKVLFNNKSRENTDAASIVEAVNRELTPITADSFTYFSLFFAILDSTDNTLEYVNGAHPEPILLKKEGAVEYLGSSSLYIGLKEDYHFKQFTISLVPGDRLVLFTDGFFELQGSGNSRFGRKRLLESLLETRSLPGDQAIMQLNEHISRFQGGRQIAENDDRAMLIIDFLAS